MQLAWAEPTGARVPQAGANVPPAVEPSVTLPVGATPVRLLASVTVKTQLLAMPRDSELGEQVTDVLVG